MPPLPPGAQRPDQQRGHVPGDLPPPGSWPQEGDSQEAQGATRPARAVGGRAITPGQRRYRLSVSGVSPRPAASIRSSSAAPADPRTSTGRPHRTHTSCSAPKRHGRRKKSTTSRRAGSTSISTRTSAKEQTSSTSANHLPSSSAAARRARPNTSSSTVSAHRTRREGRQPRTDKPPYRYPQDGRRPRRTAGPRRAGRHTASASYLA